MSISRASCSNRPPRQEDVKKSPLLRRRPPSSTTPSCALLSFLATIAASSTTAHASPAPLPFLCPSLTVKNETFQDILPRDPTPSVPPSSSLVRHIPDKYETDSRGRWRRVESYTLYGSTVCPTCQKPTNSVPSVDDQAQAPSPSPSPSSTPSSTPDFSDTLPPGWKPTKGSSGSRTTLILALSLVLAFFICFFIIGCIFWRKSKRRKRRQGDVEKKAGRRWKSQPADDDANKELVSERALRVKQKTWARATARWKANMHYTARQRRGKRIASTTRTMSSHNSSTTLAQIQDESSTLQIPTLSPPLSRRSSIESSHSNLPATTMDPIYDEQGPLQRTPSPVPPSPHTSPPAYHSPFPIFRKPSSTITRIEGGQSTSPYMLSHHTLQSSFSTSADDLYNLDQQTVDAAHVATDDKTLLARLANLASSPPAAGADPSHHDPAAQASVPVWQDEELEHFGESLYDAEGSLASDRRSRPPSPTLPFPPPPSKGKMVAPTYYDYPYSFEDIAPEPELGPSAPPFDEASCPPIDDMGPLPSAPPLLEVDTEHYIEPHPSATFGRTTNPTPVEGRGSDDPAESISQPDPELHTPPVNIFISPIQGPVGSDGTPPCYCP